MMITVHEDTPQYPQKRIRRRQPGPVAAKRIDIVSIKMVKETSQLYRQRKISSPADAASLLRPLLEENDREAFVVLCLNTKYEPTHIQLASIGTLNASLTHPREILKVSLLSNAAALIVAHNHPSGDPSPSQEDLDITKRLASAGQLLGVELLDHLIIGSDGRYTSLRESGLLPS